MSSKRMKRHEIANRLRRANQRNIEIHRGDHVEVVVTVDQPGRPGERIVTTYGVGQELECEAYQEGVITVGKWVDAEVMMFTQFHKHGPNVTECDCGIEFELKVWRNAPARLAFARLAGLPS